MVEKKYSVYAGHSDFEGHSKLQVSTEGLEEAKQEARRIVWDSSGAAFVRDEKGTPIYIVFKYMIPAGLDRETWIKEGRRVEKTVISKSDGTEKVKNVAIDSMGKKIVLHFGLGKTCFTHTEPWNWHYHDREIDIHRENLPAGTYEAAHSPALCGQKERTTGWTMRYTWNRDEVTCVRCLKMLKERSFPQEMPEILDNEIVKRMAASGEYPKKIETSEFGSKFLWVKNREEAIGWVANFSKWARDGRKSAGARNQYSKEAEELASKYNITTGEVFNYNDKKEERKKAEREALLEEARKKYPSRED